MKLQFAGRVHAVALAVIVVSLAAGGIAYANIPNSGDGKIHACFKKSSQNQNNLPQGSLRVIDDQQGQTCTNTESPLNWNQTGPAGADGAQGPQGPQGPRGPSDAWTNVSNGFLTIPPSDPNPPIVASLELPVGSYTLVGHVGVGTTTPGTAQVYCQLASGGGLGNGSFGPNLGGTVYLSDSNPQTTIPIHGSVTVTSDTFTPAVFCGYAGESPANVAMGGILIAEAVTTLH
jgi:hypothetical protein